MSVLIYSIIKHRSKQMKFDDRMISLEKITALFYFQYEIYYEVS